MCALVEWNEGGAAATIFATEFGSMAWDRAAREAATEADFVGKIGLVTTGRHATERRLPNSYPYRASTTGRPCVA